METFEVNSCIQGYYVFKSIGTQPHGKNWTACKKGQTPRILALHCGCDT